MCSFVTSWWYIMWCNRSGGSSVTMSFHDLCISWLLNCILIINQMMLWINFVVLNCHHCNLQPTLAIYYLLKWLFHLTLTTNHFWQKITFHLWVPTVLLIKCKLCNSEEECFKRVYFCVTTIYIEQSTWPQICYSFDKCPLCCKNECMFYIANDALLRVHWLSFVITKPILDICNIGAKCPKQPCFFTKAMTYIPWAYGMPISWYNAITIWQNTVAHCIVFWYIVENDTWEIYLGQLCLLNEIFDVKYSQYNC